MSYRVDMSSPDIDKQIELLKFYPEIMDKHFRKALAKDMVILYNRIKPNIPGTRAKRAFKKSLSGKGVNLQAQVYFPYYGGVAFVTPLEYGSKPHPIPGNRRFNKKPHPGFSARAFMSNGLSDSRAMIDADMAAASQAVVNEMAVK